MLRSIDMPRVLAALLVLAGLVCLAQAPVRGQIGVLGCGPARALLYQPCASGPVGFQGPGDVVSGAFAWGSCARAYSAAFAAGGGSICDIVDHTSGTFPCTMKIKTNGFADMTTALCTGNTLSVTTFCTVTHAAGCDVVKVYDQSGATNCTTACDFTHTFPSTPMLALSSLNGLPCMNFNVANTPWLQSPVISSVPAQPYSVSSVAQRTATFTSFVDIFAAETSGIQALFNNMAAQVIGYAGTLSTGVAASDSAYHAFQHVINGGSSVILVDSGPATTSLSMGATNLSAADRLDINGSTGANQGAALICEMGLWATAFNATQYGNMNANQHSATNGYNF